MRWNLEGEVIGHEQKWALWLMPGIAVVLSAIMLALPLFDPRQGRRLLGTMLYQLVTIGVILLLLVCQIGIVLSAHGHHFPMDAVILTFVGLLFIGLGNYMGKIRSNFFIGIRTPWTLSSELSWSKTHRLGGRLFFIEGVALFLVGWIPASPLALQVTLYGGLLSILLICCIYSYLIWKDDPAKAIK